MTSSHDSHDHDHDEHNHDHDHDGHSHGHGHDHSHTDAPSRALIAALVLNGIFLIVEVGVGWWTNSLALLSDAGHMVSDVAALALALAARRIALMAASKSYTYGWRRVPVLGGLINGVTLLVIVGFILFEAFERFADPQDVLAIPVLVAGAVGLAINLGSAWYLHQAGEENVNLRGAMLHMLADAAGSVAAMLSALVIWQVGWMLIDPILSVLIAALILVGSWPLVRDTVNIMLQRAPRAIDIDAVRDLLLDDDTIHAVPDLHVWQLVDGVYIATATVCSDVDQPLREVEVRRAKLKAELNERFSITHATVEWHYAPDPHEHDARNCAAV